MDTLVFEVRTGRQPSVADLTPQVMTFCRSQGDGLVSVFAPHATCGVALIETGAGSDWDLVAALEALLPRDFDWRHRHGFPGHGADHVMPALVSPSLMLPVLDGRPALGIWQSIVLVVPNRDNPVRKVRLSFIPG